MCDCSRCRLERETQLARNATRGLRRILPLPAPAPGRHMLEETRQ